jgi:hypothetical protein
MAPESNTVQGMNGIQVIMPAISPIYGNNPGYGVLDIDDAGKVRALEYSFFQLEDYYRMGVSMWRDLDLGSAFGIDLNDANTVRNYNSRMMYNFQYFGQQQALKFGVPKYLA